MPQIFINMAHLKVQKALNSDIANYIVTETQKNAKDNLNNLFGGV